MRKFERQLITEWRRLEMPFADRTIIIAVSGGADSISLLLAFDELKNQNKLNLRIVAAHFNHHLRGKESDEDESFIRGIVAARKIELATGHSNLSPQANIEQNARIERYDFLQQTATNIQAHAVLTAHTVDDQAETFLLNLIRGSGAQGLSSMRPIRKLGNAEPPISLVRPFLGWARRAETEVYCREFSIDYRSDTMNDDESFTRVRIRKILIPLLKDFNPNIVERLADTARLLQAELPAARESTGEPLDVSHLGSLNETELKQLLRAWISANRGHLRQIELKHIEAIERLIKSRKSGKTIELPGGQVVTKEAGRLVFGKNMVEKRGPDN
jgi:tRNA(Ile)-lysidine synthase